jgi:hypothetical protein
MTNDHLPPKFELFDVDERFYMAYTTAAGNLVVCFWKNRRRIIVLDKVLHPRRNITSVSDLATELLHSGFSLTNDAMLNYKPETSRNIDSGVSYMTGEIDKHWSD